MKEKEFVAVGGGLGSFVWVDALKICGAKTDEVAVIGFETKPYGRYQQLCRNSKIPNHERLRSNSDACPDNIWGWPSYAVREIWHLAKRRKFIAALKIAWQLFGEPTLAQTYTPVAGNVFQSIDREAKRIGWDEMWRYGRVKAIRKTNDGRYVIAYSQSRNQEIIHRFIIASFVHVAIGYPGIRFLPDLQKYREETDDFQRVVNAYESHEHIYQTLRQKGGVILIRGRGIVASRIIQAIYEQRHYNDQIAIVHLHRTPIESGSIYHRAQRQIEHQWEFQPFNWPKAAFGGDLHNLILNATDEERASFLKQWGGTTTAARHDWRNIIEQGLNAGWYQTRFGHVETINCMPNGRLCIQRSNQGIVTDQTTIEVDYIIDCTGLESDISDHPLLSDLLLTYQIRRNATKHLFVTNNFEIIDMRQQQGRIYASGVTTLGGLMRLLIVF